MLAGRNGLLQSAVAGSFLVASVVVLATQHEDREKKFGDKCVSDEDCHFNGSTCARSVCHCRPEFEATNHIDKCGHNAAINKPCFFNEQCEAVVFQTECRDEICACRFERTPVFHKNGLVECIAKNSSSSEPYTDPAMLCVLAGMCLMFIIICVVLRLFSKARWRENRTIFNTPNPRLMNVSLLRDNKPPPGAAGERRGSKSSTKTHSPSRQPSMASLKPQSPSLGRVGVRGGNSETVRSPTAKSAAALPMDPKPASSVAVDMTAA